MRTTSHPICYRRRRPVLGCLMAGALSILGNSVAAMVALP